MTYRVYDVRRKTVQDVPASQMTPYERWMAEESDRQAVKVR